MYEDILIKYLREDVSELTFFKGQIKTEHKTSSQYDIIICKKETRQEKFLEGVNEYINIVKRGGCLGVIELKKWAYPKMVSDTGFIKYGYEFFKKEFPDLKYIFVYFRFKDRKKGGNVVWDTCKSGLPFNDKFCFFGNVYHCDKEWETP